MVRFSIRSAQPWIVLHEAGRLAEGQLRLAAVSGVKTAPWWREHRIW